MVMATKPVRMNNLVAPLTEAPQCPVTDMRTTDTADCSPVWSGAAAPLNDRQGGVDCAMTRGTPRTATMRGIRASTTATRTTTTTTIRCARGPSADYQGDTGFSFEALVRAEIDCRRTKRNTASQLAWEINRERNLCQLHDELIDGTYLPGQSICFVITRPKPREVWAAEYRDRIVHHLLYNHIGQGFEKTFIVDSCACIKGRGTMYAAKRLETKVRSQTHNWQRPGFYLKCDVANFFVSIDRNILRQQLHRRIAGQWWRDLADTILLHDPRQNVAVHSQPDKLALVPPHKSLFNQTSDRGLPIGNLSSQFFANVYLNALDQHIKHDLGVKHYIRYVDDFVLLHQSTGQLNEWLADITTWLPRNLGIQLNPKKTILQPIDRGIDFVGQVIKPWRTALRRRTYHDALRRTGQVNDEDLLQTANSYFGLFRQCSHSHQDRAELGNVVRRRGRTIDRNFTKTYRKELNDCGH